MSGRKAKINAALQRPSAGHVQGAGLTEQVKRLRQRAHVVIRLNH